MNIIGVQVDSFYVDSGQIAIIDYCLKMVEEARPATRYMALYVANLEAVGAWESVPPPELLFFVTVLPILVDSCFPRCSWLVCSYSFSRFGVALPLHFLSNPAVSALHVDLYLVSSQIMRFYFYAYYAENAKRRHRATHREKITR